RFRRRSGPQPSIEPEPLAAGDATAGEEAARVKETNVKPWHRHLDWSRNTIQYSSAPGLCAPSGNVGACSFIERPPSPSLRVLRFPAGFVVSESCGARQ